MRPIIAVFLITLAFNNTLAYAAGTEKKMASSSDDISTLAPEFMKFTKETLFGDFWKRPELSARDKSLITITILAATNRLEQIDYHLGFALDNGLTEKEIVAAMTHAAFYAGWPSAMTGLTHLKKVLEERKAAKK